MSDKTFSLIPKPDQKAEQARLIQHLEEAETLADALNLHLCAALIDQALEQARSG